MDCIWQQQLEQRLKYERSLNFSTLPGSEDDFNCSKKKVSRDPMSHRIIEKRRRDRMNNCLADLSRLIPSNYLKKGRGRIEKTEIIEMAIKHLKQLQAHKCTNNATVTGTAAALGADVINGLQDHQRAVEVHGESSDEVMTTMPSATTTADSITNNGLVQYRLGYQECLSETMHFLVELEGLYPGDSLCIRLMNHLQKHCGRLVNGCHIRMGDDDRMEQIAFEPRMMVALSHHNNHHHHHHHHNNQEAGILADRSASSPSSMSRPVSQCPSDGGDDQQPAPSSPSSKTTSVATCNIKVEAKDISFERTAAAVEPTTTLEPHQDKIASLNVVEAEGALHGSQLREMLQNPSTTTTTMTSSMNNVAAGGGLQRGRSLSLSSSRPVSTMSNSSSSAGSSSIRGDEVYKFKRNIKERFKADQQSGSTCDNHYHHHHHQFLLHHHHDMHLSDGEGSTVSIRYQPQNQQPDVDDQDRRPETPEEIRSTPEKKTDLGLSQLETNSRKRRCPETMVNEVAARYAAADDGHRYPYSLQSRGSMTVATASGRKSSVAQSHPDVPIFALHPNGDYYVPMSVDASLIVPYMMSHRQCSGGGGGGGGNVVDETVLHHVGIAVYFRNGTAKIPSIQRILQETMSSRPNPSQPIPASRPHCATSNGFA